MGFEWDPEKDRLNAAKHNVSFDEAAFVFRGFLLSRPDLRREYGERRLVALGTDSNGVILNVVYTIRGDNIRIISAWKANRHERKAYEEARKGR